MKKIFLFNLINFLPIIIFGQHYIQGAYKDTIVKSDITSQLEKNEIFLEDTLFYEKKPILELLRLKYSSDNKGPLKYYLTYISLTSGIEFF